MKWYVIVGIIIIGVIIFVTVATFVTVIVLRKKSAGEFNKIYKTR